MSDGKRFEERLGGVNEEKSRRGRANVEFTNGAAGRSDLQGSSARSKQ